MKITKTIYNKLYKDINYIKTTYGQLYDYCGAWCNNDQMDELLRTPTYETAYKALITMLEDYYDSGYDSMGNQLDLPVDEDEKLQKIKEEWLD